MVYRTIAASNWHDGSLCLVEGGEVVKHLTAERINHNKHSEICEKTLKYFEEDLQNCGYSRIESSHHIFHAAHSFYDSGFNKAVCVVIDGMGSHVELDAPMFKPGSYGRESMSVYLMEYPNKIKLIYREVVVSFLCNLFVEQLKSYITTRISPGLMFQKTCESIGMKWYDAGKLMAMSSYGKNTICIPDSLFKGVDLKNFKLDYDLKSFEDQCDFAKSLQIKTQERVKNFIFDAIKKSKCNNVCLSGGYFLNCVANTHIHKSLPKNINCFIEPICGDDGISIGLAKLMWYEKTRSKKKFPLQNVYYGKKQKIDIDGENVTPKDVAYFLSNQKVVAIFQSKSESGPRALGNRSILYDPRDPGGKDKINKLKGRENYRPLAATVLYEHANKWFDMCSLKESPYMLYALDILSDKIPAVSHIDKTCRVQTLKKQFNKDYYNLIQEFYKITGVPVLLNTSFNLAGDTIVETIDDALNTFYNSKIDYLYFPEKNLILSK